MRAIILIEDSPRMYSVLLPLIYKEIISLTKSLMKKTFNSTYKSMHLRGRIKVLLTPNYETALKFSKKYGENIVGVISDVKFLNKGKKDPKHPNPSTRPSHEQSRSKICKQNPEGK